MSVEETNASDETVTNQKTKSLTEEIVETKEEQEINEEELFANVLSKDNISALMSSKGPTVKAILLKADGTAVQIDYDSTPSRNHVTEILNAPPSIIGQWSELDVILVGPRCTGSSDEFKLNEHKLRYPFNNDTFYGDIFLYKFDQNCDVVDFTLTDYNEFASKIAEDKGKVWQPPMDEDVQKEEEEEEDEDEEEEYDDDEMLQFELMKAAIMEKVKNEFTERFDREPTEEELESMVAATLQSFSAMYGGGADDGALDAVAEEEEYEENEDEDDAEDEDYDPAQDAHQSVMDQVEDMVNDEELKNDEKDMDDVNAVNDAPLKEIDEEEEEKLINNDEFETELKEAIESVRNVAKFDRQMILQRAREQYKLDTGGEPTDEMLAEAFSLFSIDKDIVDDEPENDADADEDDEEKMDTVDFEKELNAALDNVRNLGKKHAQELINSVCNTYESVNGVQPTTEQLSAIFQRIKQKLADEAQQEFIERHDIDIDVNVNVDENANDENNVNALTNEELQNLKQTAIEQFQQETNRDPTDDELNILISELSKLKLPINEEEEDDDDEDEDYEPNEDDLKQIEEDKQFELMHEILNAKKEKEEEPEKVKEREVIKVKVLTTPIKKKSAGSRVDIYLKNPEQHSNKKLEIAASKYEKINRKIPNDEDTKRLKDFLASGMLFETEFDATIEDEDEDDSNYDPAKDTFDYTKDEQEDLMNDENDDTSNMIDID